MPEPWDSWDRWHSASLWDGRKYGIRMDFVLGLRGAISGLGCRVSLGDVAVLAVDSGGLAHEGARGRLDGDDMHGGQVSEGREHCLERIQRGTNAKEFEGGWWFC